MSPGGAEWGMVAVTEDLMEQSRELAQLAWEFRQEARSWTIPAAKVELEAIAAHITSWAQTAALETTRGDYWARFDALQDALGQAQAARVALREWWQRGELWNSHRLRPVPATVGRALP